MRIPGWMRRGKWNPLNRRRNNPGDRRKTKADLSFEKFRGSKAKISFFRAEDIEGRNRRGPWRGRRKTERG